MSSNSPCTFLRISFLRLLLRDCCGDFEVDHLRRFRTVHLVIGTEGSLGIAIGVRSEEHTSELQSQFHLVCRLLLEKIKSCKACIGLGTAVKVDANSLLDVTRT